MRPPGAMRSATTRAYLRRMSGATATSAPRSQTASMAGPPPAAKRRHSSAKLMECLAPTRASAAYDASASDAYGFSLLFFATPPRVTRAPSAASASVAADDRGWRWARARGSSAPSAPEPSPKSAAVAYGGAPPPRTVERSDFNLDSGPTLSREKMSPSTMATFPETCTRSMPPVWRAGTPPAAEVARGRPFSSKKPRAASPLSSTPKTRCPHDASHSMSGEAPHRGTNTRLLGSGGEVTPAPSRSILCLRKSGCTRAWWNPGGFVRVTAFDAPSDDVYAFSHFPRHFSLRHSCASASTGESPSSPSGTCAAAS